MSTMTQADEYAMLVLVSTDANSNKFYELTLNGDTVTARYGRVGVDGVVKTYYGGKHKFDSQLAAKRRKGYEKVDVTNVTTKAGVASATLEHIARKKLMRDPADTALGRLIASWAAANRHNIETTSGGKITVTESGSVQTPVGMISAASILEARSVLDTIATAPTVRAVERYLTLVPQDVGRQRGWEDRWMNGSTVARQRDFLDELDGAVALAAMAADGDDDEGPDAHFAHSLVRVPTSDPKFAEMERRFSGSKFDRHTSANLRLTGLYATVISDEAQAKWKALADKKGNVQRLWHGTGDYNLLSILHRGFVVPPSHSRGTFQVTGRMFGDGVYLSDQSTKSLNYSQGYWSGRRSNHCFMFSIDAIMGNTYKPTSRGSAADAARRGHDSLFVKGGTCGVMNNEMVVWNTEQLRISYLCEFS